jgi:hypothetical protein
MQRMGLRFAEAVAQVDDGRAEWAAARGLPAIAQAMASHPENVALLTLGCYAVTSLNADGITQSHQRELMVHEQIVAALCLHIADEALQQAGMEAIQTLSQTIDNLQPLLSAGGLDCALSTLQAHHTNGSARSACAAIAAMLPTYEKSSELAAGTEVAVLEAMRLHAEEAGVQQYGADALAALAAQGIASAGGVQRVVAAMQAHPTDAAVQTASLHALDQHCRTQFLCRDICAAGAFQLVVAAMVGFEEVEGLQSAACSMLSTFVQQTGHDEAKRLVIDAGAADTVVNAMCAHWANTVLHGHGADVLVHLGDLVEDKHLAAVGMSKHNARAQHSSNGLLPW